MAPAAIIDQAPPAIYHNTRSKAKRPETKIPQFLIEEARIDEKEDFDPQKHCCFQSPSKIYTMSEIGLPGKGISETAVSAPFPLFTKDAIKQMRAEIFSEPVLNDCQFSSEFVRNTIRGMMPSRAPFVYDAWRSNEVVSKISEVAGTELIPAMDIEIAAINVSINDKIPEDFSGNDEPVNDDMSAFAWHYDSYPFVCVTMLSDCAGMIGGETAVETGTGKIMKVRGPEMGTAVVMQGRYINHQALKAFGGRERISMVVSFRPKSPFAKDESVLTGVRPISNVSDLYTQWMQYRLEVLEERIREEMRKEKKREDFNRPFNVTDSRKFLSNQIEYMQRTLNEIVDV